MARETWKAPFCGIMSVLKIAGLVLPRIKGLEEKVPKEPWSPVPSSGTHCPLC